MRAQTAVLKSLAKLVYDFSYGRDQDAEHLERLFAAIEDGEIDFSHTNPMWRYFEMTQEDKDNFCPGMADAVTPEEAGINLDLGNYDATSGLMRFGPKHNDIIRHIGDMIRFKLNLPKRKALVKLQEEIAMRKTLEEIMGNEEAEPEAAA